MNPQIEIDANAFSNAYGLKKIYVPKAMTVTSNNAWGSGATIEYY